MIISKLDKAKSAYTDALNAVAAQLKTDRGSKTAREELAKLREDSFVTGTCPYCGMVIAQRSTRHIEACRKCGRRVDRLLQLKSQISAGTDEPGVLTDFLKLYRELQYVPYALRGASGLAQDVVKAIEAVLVLDANYRLARKQYYAREAAYNVEQREKRKILDMLVSCGADPDSEETQQRVDEIYYRQYI